MNKVPDRWVYFLNILIGWQEDDERVTMEYGKDVAMMNVNYYQTW